MRLQFDASEIGALASRYNYEDDQRVLELGARARVRGRYLRGEFIEICDWKSPRVRPKVALNDEANVEETTRFALALRDPERTIETMRRLFGVDWAVGSVLLHLGHPDPYPILDFRALEALGVLRGTPVSRTLWSDYVTETRRLAQVAGVNMRTLDRALWQWSKERGTRPAPPKGKRMSDPRIGSELPSVAMPENVDVIVLGCVSSKRAGVWPAQDLYTSPLWRMSRSYAERRALPWLIFSAKHGIVGPLDRIEWYDVALNGLPSAERVRQGREAARQLAERFDDISGMTFEIHAGAAYVTSLDAPLRARGAKLVNPLAGLSIGYQLQWYSRVAGT